MYIKNYGLHLHNNKIVIKMFGFSQYLAFIIGVVILLMGFWLMLFLVNVAIVWAVGGTRDMLQERKEKREAEDQI